MIHKIAIFCFRWRGWVLSFFVLPLLLLRFHSTTLLQWHWLALFSLAALLRIWTGFHLGPHGNGLNTQSLPVNGPTQKGPFALMRHPLYFANSITALSLLGFVNCLTFFQGTILWGLFFLHQSLLTWYEEQECKICWPASYSLYLNTVPPWPYIKISAILFWDKNLNATSNTGSSLGLQLGNVSKSIVIFVLMVLAAYHRSISMYFMG